MLYILLLHLLWFLIASPSLKSARALRLWLLFVKLSDDIHALTGNTSMHLQLCFYLLYYKNKFLIISSSCGDIYFEWFWIIFFSGVALTLAQGECQRLKKGQWNMVWIMHHSSFLWWHSELLGDALVIMWLIVSDMLLEGRTSGSWWVWNISLITGDVFFSFISQLHCCCLACSFLGFFVLFSTHVLPGSVCYWDVH